MKKTVFAAIFQTGGRLDETGTEGSIYFALKDGGCWRLKRKEQYSGSEAEGSYRWEDNPITQKVFLCLRRNLPQYLGT